MTDRKRKLLFLKGRYIMIIISTPCFKARAEWKNTWPSWKQTVINKAKFRHFGDGAYVQCPEDEQQCNIDFEDEFLGVVILRCGPDKLLEGKNKQDEDHPISHSCQNCPR